MTIVEKEKYLDEQYNALNIAPTCKHQILYNLVFAKVSFDMSNYQRSLYIDIKKFVELYIEESDNLDYGYDTIQLDKIITISGLLDNKQRKGILYYAKRLLTLYGHDTEEIIERIKAVEISIAFNDRRYIKWMSLKMSSSITALFITLLIYLLIVSAVMLPAPIEDMCLFDIELHEYCNNSFGNYFLNALALLTGNEEISPTIHPNCTLGLLVYLIGTATFYIFIVNYVYRTIERIFTIK